MKRYTPAKREVKSEGKVGLLKTIVSKNFIKIYFKNWNIDYKNNNCGKYSYPLVLKLMLHYTVVLNHFKSRKSIPSIFLPVGNEKLIHRGFTVCEYWHQKIQIHMCEIF